MITSLKLLMASSSEPEKVLVVMVRRWMLVVGVVKPDWACTLPGLLSGRDWSGNQMITCVTSSRTINSTAHWGPTWLLSSHLTEQEIKLSLIILFLYFDFF